MEREGGGASEGKFLNEGATRGNVGTVKDIATQKFAFLSSQVTLKSGNRMGKMSEAG